MKINIVITGLSRDTFSAGQLVILEHANELGKRGHHVTIIPTITSYRPDWLDVRVNLLPGPERRLVTGTLRAIRGAIDFRTRLRDSRGLHVGMAQLTREVARHSTLPYRVAAMIDRLGEVIPPADVTVATGFSTTLPVWLYGTGTRVYFMQHYEVLFAPEADDPDVAAALADLSYRLPLRQIANCTWLQDTIHAKYGGELPLLCLNAINTATYFPDGEPSPGDPTVVSYSGRRAPWKDFQTAARAIAIVRETIPSLRWRVFGSDALLPPDNPIAPYEPAGFLRPDDLRQLYSRAHVLLASSWYESFPLYPLEAMACGCAVVTTPLGAEDFAVDEKNALLVPPRDPERMAAAVIRLLSDDDLRLRLGAQGRVDAQRFNWQSSGDQMERALLTAVQDQPGADGG